MANGEMLETIFLSASIPLEERNPKYFETADVIAIRDAVRALATVVIPHSILVWGGHPAITPLIRYVMGRMNSKLKEHVTLYQSRFFAAQFSDDNSAFENIKLIPSTGERESSLRHMRTRMINDHDYAAGIFIGGMEGVEDEFEVFRKAHPAALLLPVASTGAAARLIYDSINPRADKRLLDDYAYMSMFKELLKDII